MTSACERILPDTILITGGAGFIGSFLADALLAQGHHVIALDSLEPQVHGDVDRPPYLAPGVELVKGDVRDPDVLAPLLDRSDVVFHLAALVGVGQSMYDISRFTSGNTLGVAVLLQTLLAHRARVRKLLVASSMSIYGEGAYTCPQHGRVYPRLRQEEQLAARDWEVRCPICGSALTPELTDEDKPLFPTSVYAITKRDHEEMVLTVGRAYGIQSVALRFFNVYGPRQALSNPYTGAAAIFSSRLLNNNRPLIFEDGLQTRDFVHVTDIARGLILAMESTGADYEAVNLGTGRALSILQVAQALASSLGVALEPEVTNQYRAGDIRHCVADVTRARQQLGYAPQVRFEDGVDELVAWVSSQTGVEDHVAAAAAELRAKGLTR